MSCPPIWHMRFVLNSITIKQVLVFNMHSRQHTIHHDKWFPLKKNWIRLNNDRVVKGIMKAGCVGLMRDNNGVCCEYFSKKIGTYGLGIIEFMKD